MKLLSSIREIISIMTRGIGSRMLVLSSIPMILMGTVCVVVYLQIQKLNIKMENILKNTVPSLTSSMELNKELSSVESRFWQALYEKDKTTKEDLIYELEQEVEKFESALELYSGYEIGEKAALLRQDVKSKWVVIKPDIQLLKEKLLETKDDVTLQIYNEKVKPNFGLLKEKLSAIELNNADVIELNREDAAKSALMAIVIGSVVSLVLSLIISVLVSLRTVRHLMGIANSVGDAGSQVSSASQSMSTSSEKLSAGAQQQASAIEETSASLTEISGMAESNIRGAEDAETEAREVYRISEEAQKSMAQLNQAMISILQSNKRIEKLVGVIQEIGEKTQIIDDIVFKTQLLSFNASVEAERAGEHGRGFSVVAQEVGNLAQLSGRAALDISSIVKNSIKEAETIAVENKTRVNEGGELAERTSDKMTSSLHKLTSVLQNVEKIVSASKEQGQGINQISESVNSINDLTQQTANSAGVTASASTQLANQSTSLMQLVLELKKIVRGRVDEFKDGVSVEKSVSNQPTHDENIYSLKKSNKFDNKKKPIIKQSATATLKIDEPSVVTTNKSDEWEKL